MPKVYLTLAERRKADAEKIFKRQDRVLRDIIRERLSETTYDEFALKAGVSKSTVQKFANHHEEMKLPLLRRCCIAAGINVCISAEEI